MNDKEHAKAILEAARRDLRALRAMDDAEAFADEIFGFHAQQAVEKALKAWLASLGKAYPLTHDLQNLIVLLKENGVSTDSMTSFVDLNAFAVQYRYGLLYVDEEALNRQDLVERIDSLLSKVAEVLAEPLA